jgi:hypothetical protein
VIYATSVLTNIRAKMTGEFTLARFGPTEFKTLLVALGLVQTTLVGGAADDRLLPGALAFWFLAAMTAAGLAQLVLSLWRAVREVNAPSATAPDVTEWVSDP